MTPGSEGGAGLPYRPCVGIVLTNADGLVWSGQRADSVAPAWQFPQGGIDPGETPRAAALRELGEEIGLGPGDVTVLGETAAWLTYDLPPALIGKALGGRYRGQRQKWFLCRLTAEERAIRLDLPEPEFSAWRWVTGAEALEAIVPFKRAIYHAVLTEFALL